VPSPIDALGVLLFWALIFMALIYEAVRFLRRVLPDKLEASPWVRRPLSIVPLLLGAAAYRCLPAAAPGVEGALLYAWGAFVGVLSAGGHEVIKIFLELLPKRARAVLGGQAGDAPPLPAPAAAGERGADA
jgi:hypothetical protein